MKLIHLTATTIAFLGVVTAAPSRTNSDLAPRAFTSGSTTCYSKCPDTLDGYALSQSTDNSTEDNQKFHTCFYSRGAGQPGLICNYNPDGSLSNLGQRNSNDCPQKAPSAGCGSTNPDPGNAFKRSTIVKQHTEAERAIQARQFKPKRLN
ncbi:uncharacterized protein L201_006381 [Kwoniella dendrophila CBS 6074]|uniref:Uncharacterized protein n=1 Tax=Kwoniella dendrophila CBS 6074 TaxID=1295534 RepID=A0AAX4K1C2_9TREE